MTNIFLARTYADCGVPVFPCREAGERAKSPYTASGFHEASADPDRLKHWAVNFPNASYGLSCSPNGLFVLDADRHGNGDGVANLAALFARHGFRSGSVPVVKTPGDGLHFIFRKPGGLAKTRGKIAEAVDVRDNGYVIAPGNTLPDGRRYELLNGDIGQLAAAIANQSLPLMPEWLIALALQPMRVAAAPPKSSVHDWRSHNGSTPYAPQSLQSLGGLIRSVIGAPVGQRNRMLFWAACRLGSLIDKGHVSHDPALSLLIEAGQQAGLGRREAYGTALSGLREGQRGASHGC